MPSFLIPRKIMKDTQTFLLSKGKKGEEAFVLWTGKNVRPEVYQVNNIVIPEQIATKSSFGYSFDIPPHAAAKMNSEIFKLGEAGLIQVHSHPGKDTRHSSRDDKLSILSKKNALSIVLPCFGQCNFNDFNECSVYIYTGLYKWDKLTAQQTNQILTIVR